jgi:hypothetical protein
VTLRTAVLALTATLALVACRRDVSAPDYAARVGDATLPQEEVAEALSTLPAGLDSAAARQQFIEQWVTAELLAQEARRRGLPEQTDVRSALAESERAVLGAALVERFFAANPGSPSDEELASYFSEHSEELRLREPFARVRHLQAANGEIAETARASLARAGSAAVADSVWRMIAREYAGDPEGAIAMSDAYIPESRLRAVGDRLAEALASLTPGEVVVVEAAGVFHVVQLVDRRPVGSPAELDWIRADLRERVAIDRRRDLLARQVQALRTEALANGRLEVPAAGSRPPTPTP